MTRIILISFLIGGLSVILYYSLSKTYYDGSNMFKWRYLNEDIPCVRGKVLIKKTNKPSSGQLIVVTSTSGDVSGFTDDDGRYYIEVYEREILKIRLQSTSMRKKLNCENGLNIDIYLD